MLNVGRILDDTKELNLLKDLGIELVLCLQFRNGSTKVSKAHSSYRDGLNPLKARTTYALVPGTQ